MCTFNLTAITRCGHELPTIDYCRKAKPAVEAYKRAQSIGQEARPPKTCTDSLGWQMYKSLGIPVECESCIEWLAEKGLRTYGGVAAAGGKGKGRGVKRERKEGARRIKGEEESDLSGEEAEDDDGKGKESEKRDVEAMYEGMPVTLARPGPFFPPRRISRGTRFYV
ncbi:hypothetical protein LTR85_012075 [Meristemomyces frigidus]|nr:hypothetical protein LTR85_012075 [Meristemomyces frigidus]